MKGDDPCRTSKLEAKSRPHAPGDLSKVLRCGARTRRQTSCLGPAMKNGRCRLHGGLSTGPRTPAGLERSRRARWKRLLARSALLAGGESQALARAEGVAGDGVIRRNGRQHDSKATAGYRENLTLSRQREEAITPAPELDPSRRRDGVVIRRSFCWRSRRRGWW